MLLSNVIGRADSRGWLLLAEGAAGAKRRGRLVPKSGEIDPDLDLRVAARLLMVVDEGLHAVGIADATVAQKNAVATLALAGLTVSR